VTYSSNVLILRHGESEWNALGKWQGQANPPLTIKGQNQAKIAASNLNDTFDLIAASDLTRATETARIIANHQLKTDVSLHSELRERAAGPWEGLTRNEIEIKYPGAISKRLWPDGYEHDETVLQRVLPILHHFASLHEKILVVAHGGLIRALDRSLGAPDLPIPNLGGRWYQIGASVTYGEHINLVSANAEINVE
jgi:probable phosphoglycerate mutase